MATDWNPLSTLKSPLCIKSVPPRKEAGRFSCSSQPVLLDAVLAVELIHTAAGVDELLLAGVERVAAGADLDGDVLLRGAGLVDGAARAANGRGLIIRVNSGLHDNILLNTKLP